ncbi:putative cytochrome p450 protein [Botryosphaeria dothidea]|uniref:Cytochrome p450 protein n=1 Tax=Botryosphaeria dothidea TaxID=55169 RepID=A0A8H4N9H7_9PEZI|nr:putative cytochrome p450 protein [Botryosphaeria dothidea]
MAKAIAEVRALPKDGLTFNGVTSLNIYHYVAYHSPLNFKDPDSFVPERWLGDSQYDSDRKEVLQPFSFGPRNCLGKK